MHIDVRACKVSWYWVWGSYPAEPAALLPTPSGTAGFAVHWEQQPVLEVRPWWLMPCPCTVTGQITQPYQHFSLFPSAAVFSDSAEVHAFTLKHTCPSYDAN